MAQSLCFAVEGDATAEVRIAENRDGTLSVEIGLSGATAGDLRAVYLDFNIGLAPAGFTVYGDAGHSDRAVVRAGTDTLGRAAELCFGVANGLGDFDLAIEFGPLAAALGQPRSTGFTLAHAARPLTLDMIAGADFGLRFAQRGQVAAERPRGTASDALALIDQGARRLGPLARDTEGGVVAVIDLPVAPEPQGVGLRGVGGPGDLGGNGGGAGGGGLSCAAAPGLAAPDD